MRCKLVCNFKMDYAKANQGAGVMLTFGAVYDGSEENKEFFAATPGATFQMYAVNPKVADNFEMGKEYYVDFTPAS